MEKQEDLAQFIEYLRVERQYSRHTQLAYQRDITHFLSYCESIQVDSWHQVTSWMIRQYISLRHKQGITGRSIQRFLSSLRRLYRYLQREKKLNQNPVLDITAPLFTQPLPSPLTVDQMSHLLGAVDDSVPTDSTLADAKPGNFILCVRDLAMMELFYSSGLRLSELIDLEVKSINFNESSVIVCGKGDKTRWLPIGAYACRALKKWLMIRGQMALAHECALFVSRLGHRLSHRAVQVRLRQWGIRQGIHSHVHPHQLRHSFASHLLESCRDIRAVQELLGHASIKSTQIYTHLDFQHLAAVYDMAHPRAKKGH